MQLALGVCQVRDLLVVPAYSRARHAAEFKRVARRPCAAALSRTRLDSHERPHTVKLIVTGCDGDLSRWSPSCTGACPCMYHPALEPGGKTTRDTQRTHTECL
jgi:hypothetical protein